MSLIVPNIADTVHYWGILRILVKSIRVVCVLCENPAMP